MLVIGIPLVLWRAHLCPWPSRATASTTAFPPCSQSSSRASPRSQSPCFGIRLRAPRTCRPSSTRSRHSSSTSGTGRASSRRRSSATTTGSPSSRARWRPSRTGSRSSAPSLAARRPSCENDQRQLVVMRARLKRDLKTLADRLVAIYKSDSPDVISVILNANGFDDLRPATTTYAGSSRTTPTSPRGCATSATRRAPPSSASRASATPSPPARRSSNAPRPSSQSRQSELAGARADQQHALSQVKASASDLEGDVSKFRTRSPPRWPPRSRPPPRAPLDGPRAPGRPGRGAERPGVHLAGQRAGRLAVRPPDDQRRLRVPPRYRHRRAHRHADQRGGRRHGDPRAVGGRERRLRELHVHRSRRRHLDLLRASGEFAVSMGEHVQQGQVIGTRTAPATASGRTCTSRSASTAR